MKVFSGYNKGKTVTTSEGTITFDADGWAETTDEVGKFLIETAPTVFFTEENNAGVKGFSPTTPEGALIANNERNKELMHQVTQTEETTNTETSNTNTPPSLNTTTETTNTTETTEINTLEDAQTQLQTEEQKALESMKASENV